MTAELDIHVASHDELLAAHRNVFDIWSLGRPLEAHLEYRLNSPSHSRATWYVGTLEGRVVVSLGCYPVAFQVRGAVVPAIAIGSVYTVADCRGRGFAPQLLDWVERDQHARGQAVWSVLYSDIQPDYYARLGYTLCPSWEGWLEPARQSMPPAEGYQLRPIVLPDELPALKMLYASYHGAAPLSVARGDDYWQAILKKYADDTFHALIGAKGQMSAYARIGRKGDAWRITDFALADQTEALAEALYAALIDLARAGGAARFGGWLPESAAARRLFHLTPRRTEITMIKSLDPATAITPDIVAGTTRFCEIDHV